MAPEIDGKVYLTDIQPDAEGAAARPGDMALVQITKSLDYDLVGHVIEVKQRQSHGSLPWPRYAARQISTTTPLRILS
jgi:hypothetical protein